MLLHETPKDKYVNLAPGEYYFGEGQTRIQTLLGSCVAITLWHPTRHIGGMCHFLLPQRGKSQALSPGHYADEVIAQLVKDIHKVHSLPREYEAKVFGGGNMFRSLSQKASQLNVASNNVKAAFALVEEYGFVLKPGDVGGIHHRKIFFELWSGDVWVQRGLTELV